MLRCLVRRRGSALAAALPSRLLASDGKAAVPAEGGPGAHTAEFFVGTHDAALLAEMRRSDPAAARLRSVLLTLCSATVALYVGLHAAPLVGSGSVVHSSRLLRAREPLLQAAGCDRLRLLLCTSDALAAQAVQEGAAASLCALLAGGDTGVRSAAAACVEALAATPAGADALRACPGLLNLLPLAQAGDGAALRAAQALGLATDFERR